jgi:ABC-2 type transport system permease protein
MTLVTAERIKLFSTRSPYWCLIAIAVAALAFAAITGNAGDGMGASSYSVLRGANLGMSIFMVLAALSITTEYRFGTIKSTFLAAPRRPAVLLAKTALVAVLGLVVGVVVALASSTWRRPLQCPRRSRCSSALSTISARYSATARCSPLPGSLRCRWVR